MKAKTLLLIALFSFTACVYAQPGNPGLDPSFANGGILIDTSYNSYVVVNDLKLRPDGKIIVLSSGHYGAFVARYHPNGTLDSSFGTNGSRWIDSIAKPKRLTGTVCELLQDEKILIAGGTYEKIGPANVRGGFVVRLTPDGSIDSSFGNNGIQYSGIEAALLCLRSDGSIVTAGEGASYDVVINSFKIDGAVDSVFGINGLCQVNRGGFPSLAGIGILTDGRIAVVGVNRASVFYIRLLATGHLDSSFCGNGVCYTAGALYCRDAIIYPDGKVLLTGGGLNNNSSYIERLHADATPDSSFSINGDGVIPVPDLRINRVVQVPDGRIICAGMWNEHFAVARVLADGKGKDSTFGNNGIITTNVAGAHSERIHAVALQPDGKLIAGGDCAIPQKVPRYWQGGVALVRYLSDASLGVNYLPQSSTGKLKVYPNPAKTSITVDIPSPGLLQLFSLEGKLLKELHCTQPIQHLDIASLPQGSYRLQWKTANQSRNSLFLIE